MKGTADVSKHALDKFGQIAKRKENNCSVERHFLQSFLYFYPTQPYYCDVIYSSKLEKLDGSIRLCGWNGWYSFRKFSVRLENTI